MYLGPSVRQLVGQMIGEGSPFKKTRVSHSDTYSKQGSNHILLVRHERRCVRGFVTPLGQWHVIRSCACGSKCLLYILEGSPVTVIRSAHYLIRASMVIPSRAYTHFFKVYRHERGRFTQETTARTKSQDG